MEHFRHINVEHDWVDLTEEEWCGTLMLKGYDEPRILFSGFWSQGDGACFEAHVDLDTWLRTHRLGKKYAALLRAYRDGEVSVQLVHAGRYYHEYSIDVNAEYLGTETDVEQELGEVEGVITEEARELSREIYRALEKQYEYLVSDEAVAESVELNGYEFLADGRFFTE